VLTLAQVFDDIPRTNRPVVLWILFSGNDFDDLGPFDIHRVRHTPSIRERWKAGLKNFQRSSVSRRLVMSLPNRRRVRAMSWPVLTPPMPAPHRAI